MQEKSGKIDTELLNITCMIFTHSYNIINILKKSYTLVRNDTAVRSMVYSTGVSLYTVCNKYCSIVLIFSDKDLLT